MNNERSRRRPRSRNLQGLTRAKGERANRKTLFLLQCTIERKKNTAYCRYTYGSWSFIVSPTRKISGPEYACSTAFKVKHWRRRIVRKARIVVREPSSLTRRVCSRTTHRLLFFFFYFPLYAQRWAKSALQNRTKTHRGYSNNIWVFFIFYAFDNVRCGTFCLILNKQPFALQIYYLILILRYQRWSENIERTWRCF